MGTMEIVEIIVIVFMMGLVCGYLYANNTLLTEDQKLENRNFIMQRDIELAEQHRKIDDLERRIDKVIKDLK